MKFSALAGALLFFTQVLVGQTPNQQTSPLATLCVLDATAGSPAERTLLLASLVERGRPFSSLRPLNAGHLCELNAAFASSETISDSTHCGRSIRPTVTGFGF